MKLRLTIAIDDVNPKPGYRILGEQSEKWLTRLNEEFGCKFTLFIPSNYHGEYPISDYKSWISELDSIKWLELAAHGHFHMTSNPKQYGECEFFELQTDDDIVERGRMMFNEWAKVHVLPVGWRSPGWLMSRLTPSLMSASFDYAAIHYEHNANLKWGRTDFKLFYGHDGIHQTDITIHNGDMIMFQSHIAGDHKHNVWNERNFEQLELSLGHLFEQYSITPKLLKECL